ncbi:MAG: carboxypeptidase regulatory-like domain-containing protein [Acidobacteria bacterium]|nr:MAG: carboxypeptidase regulatory-like domain-containing protein [Acidobacteriota bacterium]
MPCKALISTFSSPPIRWDPKRNRLAHSRGLRWLVLSAALAFLPVNALAQANFASVSGEVLDAQKAAIPGATIILTSSATGLRRSTVSNGTGFYDFTDVNPGDYQLRVEASGFQSELRNFVLAVNQVLRLDLALQVGSKTQQVVVKGVPPPLRTTDATLGEVIDPTLTGQLPLDGRHVLDLAIMAPATAPNMGMGVQDGNQNQLYWRPGQGTEFTAAGNRANANYYLLDGTADSDPTFWALSLSPSPDAIQEFKVQTGSYSAEFGGAGGAQVNMITRSGTNNLHGTAYEYLRNTALDARVWNATNVPHLVQNQFGASLGGPIQKNKTFFFANYEGFRFSNQVYQVETVPTMAERSGDFSQSGQTIYEPSKSSPNPDYNPALPVSASNPKIVRSPFPGNMIPTSMISSVAAGALQHVPLPNIEMPGGSGMRMGMGPVSSGLDSNNYLDVRTATQPWDEGTFRLDRNFGAGDAFFTRYTIEHESGFTPVNLPGFGLFNDNMAQNLTISYTHIFSPTMINNLSFGMSRLSMHEYSENNFTHDYVSELGVQGVSWGGKGSWGMPYFNVQGYSPIGDSFSATPVHDWDTLLQVQDTWNWQKGRHSLKAGGGYLPFFWPMWGFFQTRGYYQFTNGFTTRTATNDGTGSGLASFLLGLPVVKQRQAGVPQMNLRQWYGNAYVEDNWRITDATTLDIGLRYEYMSSLSDLDEPGANLIFRNGGLDAFVGGQAGMPRGLWYPNGLNFAPRFGFAHQIRSLGIVFRGGFGMFFTPVDMNTWCNQRHNPPYVFAETRQSDNYVPSLSGFDFAPPVLGKTVVSFASLDPHSHPQYINQWSFSVQKALPGNIVAEIGYQGSRGYHLQRAYLINNAPPGPGPVQPRRPYQTITFVPGTSFEGDNPESFAIQSNTFPVSAINYLENTANSWYDAGWIDARREFHNGLTFLANYTWSKGLTDAPDFRSAMMQAAVPQNNSDLAAEKGPNGMDVPHRFVASVVYSPPGWGGDALLHRLTSSWTLGSIFTTEGGMPFTVGVFGDTANAGTLLGQNPIRANETGQPVFPTGTRTTAQWFSRAAFAAPAPYTFGNAGVNTVYGPSFTNLDLALQRQFSISERLRFIFRAEAFNALNHSNWGYPNNYVNTPQFGSITMAEGTGREIQLSARFDF